MDLDFNPRTIGRVTKPITAVVIRELTAADVELLATEAHIQPITIKKLRDSHHALARCLASGMSAIAASAFTGYTVSRISVLRTDPSFKELLAFYAEAKEVAFADAHERMATLSLEAIEELRERLHDSPEQFTPMGLLKIVETTADRTGYGPTSKSLNITANVDLAGRLERARQRVKEDD